MDRVINYLIAFMLMMALVGCQSLSEESAESTQIDYVNELGDVRELTASLETMPAFLENYSESIAAIYERVPHYQDTIQHIPCYCGCGESIGHTSSYDCFINKHLDDQSIVWDDHGAKCGVCLEIAYYSMELHDEGVSIEDIRQFIDERYEEGYSEPTNTPMPVGA